MLIDGGQGQLDVALEVMADLGVDDIAVVGWDDIEDGGYATPRLTTIAPDKRAIARTAVRGALQLDPVITPHIDYVLQVRESTVGAG